MPADLSPGQPPIQPNYDRLEFCELLRMWKYPQGDTPAEQLKANEDALGQMALHAGLYFPTGDQMLARVHLDGAEYELARNEFADNLRIWTAQAAADTGLETSPERMVDGFLNGIHNRIRPNLEKMVSMAINAERESIRLTLKAEDSVAAAVNGLMTKMGMVSVLLGTGSTEVAQEGFWRNPMSLDPATVKRRVRELPPGEFVALAESMYSMLTTLANLPPDQQLAGSTKKYLRGDPQHMSVGPGFLDDHLASGLLDLNQRAHRKSVSGIWKLMQAAYAQVTVRGRNER